MMSMMSFYLILIISILVSVAFYTLLERKILSYTQIRKGPNKVGFMGLLQPIMDGGKLFLKENLFMNFTNLIFYYLSPIMGLTLSFMFWFIYPTMNGGLEMSLELLIFLSISSLSVYALMGMGYSSNSCYAMLGCIRAVAQMISYEVSLAFIVISMAIITSSFSLKEFTQNYWSNIFMISSPLFLMWLISSLAETNRSPFDFAEGESELVSGFNVEYASGGFALIFIAEYANIIFMSLLTTILFFSGHFMIVITLMIMIWFLWVRSTFPRYRYDYLMMLAWKSFLPIILGYFIFLYFLSLLMK